MTLRERYNVLYKALDKIVKLNESSCERHAAKADSIALDAIVTVDCDTETQEPSATKHA